MFTLFKRDAWELAVSSKLEADGYFGHETLKLIKEASKLGLVNKSMNASEAAQVIESYA